MGFLAVWDSSISLRKSARTGAAPLTPLECVPIDYKELMSSDVVVAVVGMLPSLGIALELGWASAQCTAEPTVILVGDQRRFDDRGLDRVADVRFIDKDFGHDAGRALGRRRRPSLNCDGSTRPLKGDTLCLGRCGTG